MLPEEPTEALKLTVLPLRKETTTLSESVRDLKNEFFSARPEAEPTDAVNPRIRPLNSEPPTVNDPDPWIDRSEEHTSELQSLAYLVCRLLLEKKKKKKNLRFIKTYYS